MRRTLLLAGLVAAAALLVRTIDPPRRRTAADRARGPHVFRTSARGVRRLAVVLGPRRFTAERTRDGWRLDGDPAAAHGREALDDLAALLATLRAVDAFRGDGLAALGLDPPTGTIVVTTHRGEQRLALGTLNSSGGTLYARRDEHGRVLQVGVYLLSALERVFTTRDHTAA